MKLFAMKDGEKGAMSMVSQTEARSLNQKGFGIFHTVNDFHWERVSKYKGRTIDNVKQILFWTAESDDLSKEEQIALANKFCSPTFIVESKKSMHLYWQARTADLDSYRLIQKALAEIFKGDLALQNPAHTLRTPGFYHWKDPSDPFLVKKVWEHKIAYRQKTFIELIERKLGRPIFPKPVKRKKMRRSFEKGTFWDRLDRFDQGELLERISSFAGETFEIRKNQIFVNGRQCEAWIDADGKIGSRSGGGPTVVQWIQYYGHTKEQAIEIIKDLIPELRD